jgi:acyl-CoA synthetase (AMP-forming)/AMP-acid ligase II
VSSASDQIHPLDKERDLEMNRDNSHDRQDWAAHGFAGEAQDLITAGSLPAAWAKQWALNPGAFVLRDYQAVEPTVETQWLTAGELEVLTRAGANRFAAAGLQRGDRIVMSCAPSVKLIVAHVAALRLGAIVVPVNPAYSATEVSRVIDVAKPTIALADDPE